MFGMSMDIGIDLLQTECVHIMTYATGTQHAIAV